MHSDGPHPITLVNVENAARTIQGRSTTPRSCCPKRCPRSRAAIYGSSSRTFSSRAVSCSAAAHLLINPDIRLLRCLGQLSPCTDFSRHQCAPEKATGSGNGQSRPELRRMGCRPSPGAFYRMELAAYSIRARAKLSRPCYPAMKSRQAVNSQGKLTH